MCGNVFRNESALDRSGITQVIQLLARLGPRSAPLEVVIERLDLPQVRMLVERLCWCEVHDLRLCGGESRPHGEGGAVRIAGLGEVCPVAHELLRQRPVRRSPHRRGPSNGASRLPNTYAISP